MAVSRKGLRSVEDDSRSRIDDTLTTISTGDDEMKPTQEVRTYESTHVSRHGQSCAGIPLFKQADRKQSVKITKQTKNLFCPDFPKRFWDDRVATYSTRTV